MLFLDQNVFRGFLHQTENECLTPLQLKNRRALRDAFSETSPRCRQYLRGKEVGRKAGTGYEGVLISP